MTRNDHYRGTEQVGANGSSPVFPAPGELYRALASERRRHVLYHLLEHQRCHFDDLVDVLVDGGLWGEQLEDEPRESVYVSLYHSHLPLLEDVGLLTYESDAGEVRLRPMAAPVRETIERAHDYDRAIEKSR